jgi:multidrug efflux pump subunit AcrA (membrane-fusion protein)
MKLSKLKNPYVIVAIVVLIVGGYYWYSKSKSSTTVVQYKTTAAEKGTLTTSVSGSGNIIVDTSASVDPTITGTVSNLAVKVGDSVKEGQILFTIDNDDLLANWAKAQATYAQAKKTYKPGTDHTKQEKLNFAASKAEYESQKTTYEKRNVISPIDGTVNAVNVKNGDDLSRLSSSSNSSAPIIVGDLSTLKAQIEVNEVDIANVSIGQKVTLTFSAIDDLVATGKVEKMDSLGTLTSGVVTYNVTISFDSLDDRIKPEMSVSAEIITNLKQDIITVSNGAIKTSNGGNYVQVLVNGKPENRTVETGIANDTDTEIISGVSVGDNIITQTINSSTSTSTSSSSSSTSSSSSSSSSSSKSSSSNNGPPGGGIMGF